MLLLALIALGHETPVQSASAGQMRVSWTWESERLLLELEAPTTGWVAVGVNDTADLANSRLVMASIRGCHPVAEEHVARPPHHPHVADLEVLDHSAADGWTRITVALPREPSRPDAPVLAPGDRIWLTLAWSRSDDFDHHSAMRTAQWVIAS